MTEKGAQPVSTDNVLSFPEEGPGRRPAGLRFGCFELDLVSGELRKEGSLVKLQQQPFKVLALLAQHPRRLVTRKELQRHVWGEDRFVDFEQGINVCIMQIRAALEDQAAKPEFIETLPRRGYRFIASVEELDNRASDHDRGVDTPPARITIAVLPFASFAQAAAEDYFSDGLTEEMIAELGRLHPKELGVIARTSVMRYKTARIGVAQIGAELGVDYVLEGSVRRSGERARITSRLVRVEDQSQVWTETYDLHLRDILSVQARIAGAIARGIRLVLPPQQAARCQCSRRVDPEAHRLSLMGAHFYARRGEKGLRRAVDYYEDAIGRDASFAPAHAGLAAALACLADYCVVCPTKALARAEVTARKALELDGDVAKAHAVLGLVAGMRHWDHVSEEAGLKRALELDPSNTEARKWHACLLAHQGRREEALCEARAALQTDPLSLTVNLALASILLMNAQLDAALTQAQRALEIDNSFALGHLQAGEVLLEMGRKEEALQDLQRARELDPDSPVVLSGLGCGLVNAGHPEEARRVLIVLEALGRKRPFIFYLIATVHAALGQETQALDRLEAALEAREPTARFLPTDSKFSPLRSSSRFAELVRRVEAAPH
jgi:TolB-like protein/Tfp pilus assembly protein PilF